MEAKRVLPRPINTAEEYLRALLEEVEALRADVKAAAEGAEPPASAEAPVDWDAVTRPVLVAMKAFHDALVDEMRTTVGNLQRVFVTVSKAKSADRVSVDEEKLANAIVAAIKQTKSGSARKKKQLEPRGDAPKQPE